MGLLRLVTLGLVGVAIVGVFTPTVAKTQPANTTRWQAKACTVDNVLEVYTTSATTH
jgi:hypothetical protein